MADNKNNDIKIMDGTSNKDNGNGYDPYEVKYVPRYQQALPRVVEKAKGEKRSYAKFTEDVNAFLDEESKITPAFFSRIINYKILNPIKTEIIKAIAKTSANKFEANYTDLMDANGMVRYKTPEELVEMYKKQEERFKKYQLRDELLEETIPGIIKDEMVNKGAMFRDGCKKVHLEVSNDNQFGLEFKNRADFGISLWAEDDRIESWLFFINYRGSGYTYLDSKQDNGEVQVSEEMNAVMRNAEAFFLIDAWKPDLLREIRVSFAFINPETFELYYNQLKDIKLNAYFSLILLDREKKTVVEERKLGDIRWSPFDPKEKGIFDKEDEFEIVKNKHENKD